MLIIIALFSIAASIGLYLIYNVFKGRRPMKAIAISHGLFAATSVVLLILEVVFRSHKADFSLISFTVAASIGLFMF